jgi:hypothetical protein
MRSAHGWLANFWLAVFLKGTYILAIDVALQHYRISGRKARIWGSFSMGPTS